jgi:pyruvate dehydrogenase E2 component (dihydrolipoamide acetyltransferase)
MSVSVSMPQLGESVTEGTVTRWLKREGEHVQADEPLLEVSTDKVDTEIPSPVSGILRGITVAEDETVAVGAELAVIDEDGAAAPPQAAPAAEAAQAEPPPAEVPEAEPAVSFAPAEAYTPATAPPEPAAFPPAAEVPAAPPAAYNPPAAEVPAAPPAAYNPPPAPASPVVPAAPYQPSYETGNGHATPAAAAAARPAEAGDGPYVTPLVRKLAAEHGIDLASVAGTGVGGRIRKQDILDAVAAQRGPAGLAAQPAVATAPAPAQQAQAFAPAPAARAPAAPAPAAPAPAAPAPAASAPAALAPAAPPIPAAPATPSPDFAPPQARGLAPADTAPAAAKTPQRPAIVPSSLRGTTERMSRARQVIAQRMVESLQTSAQLTTVVEADVTDIARLRGRAKAAFEAREGVKLSFLPFFALATVEALKVHPKLNAVIDTASGQVTYHDAEHLGVAVDTERGLMVPVIRNAGDLNIGGLARKIADLAERTRAGQVSPDELAGGTFTLTNTGSRGALFDTPIINQPQVGILGTGTVVKRAVVVEDPTLGEVITVRSMVYLALTYDHRLVDGADAARFLATLKARLEEGAFETELGL